SFRNLDEPEKYLSAEFALMAIDEITQIPLETFKILLTRLRYPGIEDTKFICASNPIGEHMLWVRQFFVEKNLPIEFEKYRNQIAFIKALPHDNPYLNDEYFEQLKSLPEKERGAFLEGNWYAFEGEMDESGFISLITSKELENAFVFGEEFEKIFKNSENILGVDVGAGGDKTAIVLRNNLLAKVVFNQKLEDTMQIITLIFNLSKIYPIVKICIDAIGVGRGVVDRLREIGFLNLIPIVLGNKPSEPDFLNIRAELYWKLRNWILGGGKLIKDDSFNQLLNIKYKKNSDRKIMIIPKDILRKKGIPSPDVADALALTFFVDIDKIKSLLNFQKEWYNI
ncbi:MAG: phage terminase large subunit, partial [Candidatus Omnitrophica bacterium]|nr:phage terminase large subunit [Candidatus Omnitrophota bacterium]